MYGRKNAGVTSQEGLEAADEPQPEPQEKAAPRKRTGKPKVKSGCITCKTRKVKCDETKPSCLRCSRLELPCGGYPMPKPKKLPPQPKKYILLPSVLTEPTAKLFGDEQEWQYFQLFRTEAAAELTGFFAQPLWDRIILQACHSELFVREAVLAISASRLARSGKAGSLALSLSPDVVKHREAALSHYGKTIRTIKESLAKHEGTGDERTRRILIACLLVCCLEGMWGNSFNALAHARSGSILLGEWMRRNPHVRKDRIGIYSPAPEIVEDEIVHAFARLDIQMLTFIDTRTAEEHALMAEEGQETIESMPVGFSLLEEARTYFELVSRRALHFMQVAVRALADEQKAGIETDVSALEDGTSQSWVKAGQPYGQKVSKTQVTYYQVARKKHADELARWKQAFLPLYKSIQQKTYSRSLIAAHLLFVNFIMVDIILATCLYTENMAFDQHFEGFRTVVDISKIIAEAKQSRRFSFSFDSGLTPLLSAVCKLVQRPHY